MDDQRSTAAGDGPGPWVIIDGGAGAGMSTSQLDRAVVSAVRSSRPPRYAEPGR